MAAHSRTRSSESRETLMRRLRNVARTAAAGLVLALPLGATQLAAEPDTAAHQAAGEIAHIFSALGDRIYEDCIFELSEEQVEVQAALIQAYIEQGAAGPTARRLAATQIQPP